MVMAYFDVTAGPPKLRLALLRREDLEKLRAGAPHSVIDVTGESAHGALPYPVRERGDYALVIDNQGRAPAIVHIRVWLDFARHGPVVTQLSPERQLVVIADQLSRVLWNRELFRPPAAAHHAPLLTRSNPVRPSPRARSCAAQIRTHRLRH